MEGRTRRRESRKVLPQSIITFVRFSEPWGEWDIRREGLPLWSLLFLGSPIKAAWEVSQRREEEGRGDGNTQDVRGQPVEEPEPRNWMKEVEGKLTGDSDVAVCLLGLMGHIISANVSVIATALDLVIILATILA